MAKHDWNKLGKAVFGDDWKKNGQKNRRIFEASRQAELSEKMEEDRRKGRGKNSQFTKLKP